jgi:hypothetical protein
VLFEELCPVGGLKGEEKKIFVVRSGDDGKYVSGLAVAAQPKRDELAKQPVDAIKGGMEVKVGLEAGLGPVRVWMQPPPRIYT